MQADLLITNARIVNGLGTPWFRGAVAARGGRIVAMGAEAATLSAAEVVDAQGRYLAPGFIDMHTHSDFDLLRSPDATGKLRQGVTTQAIGHCGYSAAPVCDENLALLDAYTGFLKAGVQPPWTWRSFAQWLAHLEALPLGTNVVSFVGHGTLRIAVMGFSDQPASPAQLAAMRELAARCMAEGAVGMTSGLIYAPGIYASADELVEVARGLAPLGGLYESHMRNESDDVVASVAELIEVGRRAGIAAQISHHKACGMQNYGRVVETLALVDQARAQGQDVTLNFYPYDAASTTLRALLPAWVQEGGIEALAARLADPAVRERLRAEIEGDSGGWDNYYRNSGGAKGVILLFFPKTPQYEGRTLAEAAADMGRHPLEAAFDLIIRNRGEDNCAYKMISEADMERIMRHPAAIVASDSIPCAPGGKSHPRLSGTFPRVLDRYVRQRKVLSLEEAVRKMSALPAQRMGLYDRGVIAPGLAADLVLLDMERLRDNATFADPAAAPEGIDLVVVGGAVCMRDGQPTDARPGRVLRPRRAGG
jgi:N-acyl-D-amino-acid deacylase